MSWDGQLLPADPKLEQPRIDIHQCRSFEASKEARFGRIMEIQEQVGVAKNSFGLFLADSNIFQAVSIRTTTGSLVKNHLFAQTISVHSSEEGAQKRGIILFVTA